jgi:hypothetical protein
MPIHHWGDLDQLKKEFVNYVLKNGDVGTQI